MAQPSTRTVSYRAPRLAPASEELVALCGMALLAATLGLAIGRFDAFSAKPASSLLLTVGALASLAVIMAGPVPCLAAIAGLTAGGLDPTLADFGGVNVTLADIFYSGLVGWWLLEAIRSPEQRALARRPPIAFGQGVAIVFFVYAGLTLLKVATSDPAALSDSFISWLRLVQTASLAWLAASMIQTGRDLRLLLAAVAAGGVVTIAVAVFGGGGNLLADRFGGTMTPDALGIVSAWVCIIGVFGGVTPKTRYRIALAVIGLLGLLLAKSVASLVATGFALALGMALAKVGLATASRRVVRTALVVALAGVLVFGAVRFLRPNATPGSNDFTGSSTYQRLVLGSAGLEIFARNPVLGVGWRESNSPRLLGNRAINAELRRRFPDSDPTFYPDVILTRQTTSVHNTYIQILADLGMVGFLLLASLVWAVAVRVRNLLLRLGPGHELWPQAWVMSLGLLVMLIWLNDNPLFGGQPETVIPALFVGALAATSRLAQTSPR
jgi:O-antigen ligase